MTCPYYQLKPIGDEVFDYCSLEDMYITESDCKDCPEKEEEDE